MQPVLKILDKGLFETGTVAFLKYLRLIAGDIQTFHPHPQCFKQSGDQLTGILDMVQAAAVGNQHTTR